MLKERGIIRGDFIRSCRVNQRGLWAGFSAGAEEDNRTDIGFPVLI